MGVLPESDKLSTCNEEQEVRGGVDKAIKSQVLVKEGKVANEDGAVGVFQE